MRLGGLQMRLLSRWGAAGAVAVTALGALTTPAHAATAAHAATPGHAAPAPAAASGIKAANGAKVLFSEGFTGQDTPSGDWISKNTGGKYRPCLSAAAQPGTGGIPWCVEVQKGQAKPDQDGAGAFEITNNAVGESGFGLYTRPLDTAKGLRIDFDIFQHNARTYDDGKGKRGGDGIAFFLLNGAASPADAGEAGGSLGYRGLPGGEIGLGFDEFGNFSDPKWGGKGGPGTSPNSIVLRGAETTGYKYITGVRSPAALAVDHAVQRDPARRHVTITLSTKNQLSVYVNYLNGKGPRRVIGPLDLNKIKGQPPLPPTIKFGFAAATGAATAYHELQGMRITGLPPDLRLAVAHSGSFQPGGTGAIRLTVTNDKAAGPTTGDATVKLHLADGLTAQSPAGEGWNCAVSGQDVTCTRSDVLDNGASYAPITVPVAVGSAASGTLNSTATVSDPGDTGTAGKTVTDTVKIGSASPDIAIALSHSGTFRPDGTLTATVSNKPAAGPSTGPVTVTVPVPDGLTPVSAAGSGWKCSIQGQTATCTRADTLPPGASYPPVNVKVTAGNGTDGDIPVTATGSTPGDANPESVTATDTVTIAPLPPDLSLAITANGPFQAGSTGVFTLTTANAPAAGPTTGPVTTTFDVPAGLTLRSAAGDGWACSVSAGTAGGSEGASGAVVTCTRPGSGADALPPGMTYPPVKVMVGIPNTASGQVTGSATVGTPGDSGNPGQTGKATVKVTPLAPDLGVTISAPQVTAGDDVPVTLVATDNPNAGPVTGPTTVTFPVPAGYTVKSADGPGWTCTTGKSEVTCTRSDPLPPGASFPPATVTLQVPATASGQVPVTATAQTAGQPAAGRGSGTLQFQAKPPKLAVGLGHQGTFTAGQSGSSYQITVSDDPAAGPVTGPVTVTFPLPSGMTATSVSGDGWDCSASAGATVSCKRSDPLAPGASYPQITVITAVPAGLSGPVPATATAATGDSTASADDTVTIGQLAPSVSVAVTPPADGLPAGGTGTYTIVATNAPDAGPAAGPTKITFTVPDGLQVTDASGDGWQCGVTGQVVSCLRTDPLPPGASFPPVAVTVSVPDAVTGTATTTAGLDTPGNSAGASATQVTTSVQVTPLAPDPTVGVGCQNNVPDDGSAYICVNVGDSASAGPVSDGMTVDIPAPAGMTPATAGGPGWDCGDNNAADGFICVNTGDLAPGQQYSPIATNWQVNGDVTGTVPVTATAFTPGADGASATAKVTETPAAPQLSADVVSSGPVQAGATADLTVNVGDAAGAGPAAGDTAVTIPLPQQLRPASVYGDGWDCSTQFQEVACHRAGHDPLLAGEQYPPITVAGDATAPWDGTGITAAVAP